MKQHVEFCVTKFWNLPLSVVVIWLYGWDSQVVLRPLFVPVFATWVHSFYSRVCHGISPNAEISTVNWTYVSVHSADFSLKLKVKAIVRLQLNIMLYL